MAILFGDGLFVAIMRALLVMAGTLFVMFLWNVNVLIARFCIRTVCAQIWVERRNFDADASGTEEGDSENR